MIEILSWLLFAHAITDLALQHDYIGTYKWRCNNSTTKTRWVAVSVAHGMINGAGVALVTGNVYLGWAESVAHTAIDYGTTERWWGLAVDQALHFSCKVLWVALICMNLT